MKFPMEIAPAGIKQNIPKNARKQKKIVSNFLP